MQHVACVLEKWQSKGADGACHLDEALEVRPLLFLSCVSVLVSLFTTAIAVTIVWRHCLRNHGCYPHRCPKHPIHWRFWVLILTALFAVVQLFALGSKLIRKPK